MLIMFVSCPYCLTVIRVFPVAFFFFLLLPFQFSSLTTLNHYNTITQPSGLSDSSFQLIARFMLFRAKAKENYSNPLQVETGTVSFAPFCFPSKKKKKKRKVFNEMACVLCKFSMKIVRSCPMEFGTISFIKTQTLLRILFIFQKTGHQNVEKFPLLKSVPNLEPF